MQPWRVVVLRGESKQRFTETIINAHKSGQSDHADYQYYPEQWFEPYGRRRKTTGLALYSALGIGKDDKQARQKAWEDNYHFFGAPVGLLVFLDRRLGQGSLIDIGMFMQSVMLAAQDLGLATCPEASVADYPNIIRDLLNIEHNWALAGGIALGYADMTAAVNNYRTTREEVESFTSWYD